MAKDDFTTYFQQNLCKEIKILIANVWGYQNICVDTEVSKKQLDGLFNGFIDIAITNADKIKSIVAIEIEHISEYPQASQNIKKLKKWAHNSNLRKCAMLHLFNESCKISEPQIDKLINEGKEKERQGLGFYYDFAFYKVNNKNKTAQIPKELVASKEFRVRLWKLINDSELLN